VLAELINKHNILFRYVNTLAKIFTIYFVIYKTLLYLHMAKKIKTGRKKVAPEKKVILVGFYTRKEVVDMNGGMEQTRELAKQYIENIAQIH
jgi:hypothetical protein